MSNGAREEVRGGLEARLPRLWRYALSLSGARDVAEDLVQATCLRAIERAEQFQPGTRLDRWLFTILRSIWLNESRSRRVRAGQGVLDAGEALSIDGAHEIETNISAAQVLRAIGALPAAQRETVLLVYVEGYSVPRGGRTPGGANRHNHEPTCGGAGDADSGRTKRRVRDLATSDDDDRELTAYLDGELDEAERAALDARLEGDPTLRARLGALRAAADRTRLAFAALLETAPLADMRTRLDAALAASPARAAPPWRQRVAATAAAVAIVAFAAGLGAGRWSAGFDGEPRRTRAIGVKRSSNTWRSTPPKASAKRPRRGLATNSRRCRGGSKRPSTSTD